MSNSSFFCIAATQQHAEFIVLGLRHTGFWSNHVSALIPHLETPSDPASEQSGRNRAIIPRSTRAGDIVGNALLWLAGIGALTIPGLGFFTATGPILAALSGAALGVAFGGLAGGLTRLGLSEGDARRLAGRVTSGKILLAVQTHNQEEMQTAEHILKDSGAEDICLIRSRPD